MNEAREKIRAFAENIIQQADTVDSLLDNRPDLQPEGSMDPKDWGMMRHYAKKILAAVNADTRLDPAWFQTIQNISARHTAEVAR